MQSKAKIRLLLTTTAFILVLGWALEEWRPGLLSGIPYYQETTTRMRTFLGELQQRFATAPTSSYGIITEQNIAGIGGIYGLIGILMLLKPSYRNAGWERLGTLSFGFMAFVVLFVGAFWISTAGSEELRVAHGETLFTGLIYPLLIIAFGLTLWVGVPMYLLFFLFAVPSVLYVILRLLGWLPILAYHYLHYLAVPHPAEQVYTNGMARGVPLPELARDVARAMYIHDLNIYKRPPPAWKSQNQKKRIEEAEKLLHAGRAFMEECERYVLQDEKLRDD